MKRLLLLSVFASASLVSVAQPNQVVSAYNYHKYYMERGNKLDDLMKAQESIDEAAVHEKTLASSKTWFYRGKIYHSLFESKEDALKDAKNRNLAEAVKSYEKALELDKKKEYHKEIIARIDVAQIQFYNLGVELDNDKKFLGAVEAYENAAGLKLSRSGKIDTLSLWNASFSARDAKDYNKAVELCKKIIDGNQGAVKHYFFIIETLKQLKEEEKAMEFVRLGRAAFPNEKDFLIEEYNYYSARGELEQAIKNLELAIEKDPKNPLLLFTIGTVYDGLANPAKDKPQPKEEDFQKLVAQSEMNYKKALEVKPDYFDAYFNLGALYFNQAVRIVDFAKDIKDNKKYEAEVKKADAKFAVALPYFERAFELDPKDVNTINSLKQLYARMGDAEGFKKMKALLEN